MSRCRLAPKRFHIWPEVTGRRTRRTLESCLRNLTLLCKQWNFRNDQHSPKDVLEMPPRVVYRSKLQGGASKLAAPRIGHSCRYLVHQQTD